MGFETEDDDQAVIDATEADHDDEQHDAQDSGETPEQDGADDVQGEVDGAADEVVVSIGDEQPAAEDEQAERAPAWVKELRKTNRTLIREKRELEAKLAAKAAPADAQSAVVVGVKPTLESCDYDEGRFVPLLEEWHSRKRAADDQQRQQQAEQQKVEQAWSEKRSRYESEANAFRARNPSYTDAEERVQDALSTTQQGLILHAAEQRVKLIAALALSPKTLQEVAAISDPILFTARIARLETKLKETPRKSAPTPERIVRGSGPVGGVVGGAQLDKLREDAQRTGDYSRYLAAKRSAKK